MFVCMVMSGKWYPCPQEDGCALQDGYDSHRSECQSEWVIFDSSAVVPIYLIRSKTNIDSQDGRQVDGQS